MERADSVQRCQLRRSDKPVWVRHQREQWPHRRGGSLHKPGQSRLAPVERVTRVSAGTLLDSKSELSKLSSGQTEKSQKVAIGSLNQESSGSNAVSFAESVVGAAVRAAVKP